ncbi:MAG: cation:proton antiporter [Candidatus Magnetoovum sp. WYHC-5]|nr:cation:proton antiporter [Candidatus Magnetoovum sp. WYHC-5]
MEAPDTVNYVLLFVIFLFIASLSSPIVKKLRFPHSIFLVTMGLCIYLLSSFIYTHVQSGSYYEMAKYISSFRLTDDVIMYIFLPTLVFESAYNINSRLLINNLLPIITMAVPAMLVSALIIGVGLHYINGMHLLLALLFGTIISSTDPVAVVSIFKEIGAPKRLTLLVEGEGLFNDATTIVMFGILVDFLVLQKDMSLASSLFLGGIQLVIVFIGGAIVGLILGYVFLHIIGFVKNSMSVEIIHTTILAYFSFIIADRYLHVSGVMSTVAAGLMVGTYGKGKVSKEVHMFMEHFWETMAFSANSFLFLALGLIFPHYISYAGIQNCLPLIITAIVTVLVGRAIAVFIMLPIITQLGALHKISIGYKTVIWWGGGLKGAIAVALPLSLVHSTIDKGMIEQILLLTFVVVVFTLITNGLTINKVINWFGIGRLKRDEIYIRKLSILHAKSRANHLLIQKAEEVKHYKNVYNEILKGHIEEEVELKKDLEDFKEMSDEEKGNVLVRQAFFLEKGLYYEAFNDGELSEDGLIDLNSVVDRDLDRLKGNQPIFTKRLQFEQGNWQYLLVKPFLKFFPKYVKHILALRYEKAKVTLNVIDELIEFISQLDKEFSGISDICTKLKDSYITLGSLAQEEMTDIAASFPEYVDTVVAMVVKKQYLHLEESQLSKMYDLGQLPENVYTQIIEDTQRQLIELHRQPVETILSTPDSLLKDVPFFQLLKDEEIKNLTHYFRAIPFVKGETLISENTHGSTMFIITKGVIQLYKGKSDNTKYIATLKSGDVFGAKALLSKQHYSVTAVALTHGFVLALNHKHLDEFLNNNPNIIINAHNKTEY